MITFGYWKAGNISGEFTLSSCCVSPRFYFKDFEMLKNLDPSLRPAKTIQKLI